jgi:hypothetical protein
MANHKNHWTTPRQDGKWESKREGGARGRVFDTQAEAWDHTKQHARKDNGEAYLQNRQGQIRERNTYGHDPKKIKG